MKTQLLTLALILLCLTSAGQIKGINLSEIKSTGFSKYEECYYTDNEATKTYSLIFELTSVGLKHCIEKARTIAVLNDMDFDQPNGKKDELFASYVGGITDYENLSLSIEAGGSEVKRIWDLKTGQGLALNLTKGVYAVFIFIKK